MIDYNYLQLLVKKYAIPGRKNALILIPFKEFPKIEPGNSVREYDWWAIAVSCALAPDNIALSIANYTINCICVKRMYAAMNLEVTISIPYGNRSVYKEMLYDVCNLISSDGDVTLFISNNPYALKAYAVISEENKTHADQIRKVLKQYHVQYESEKGLKELMKETGIGRMYDIVQLPTHEQREMFFLLFENRFFFPEESALREKGYDLSVSIKRKKIFISYCHKDKAIVNAVTDMLEESGANLWIDKKSIDYGENFTAAISSGIDECDLAIIFLSEGYSNSKYARYELQNIVCKMIQENMKWISVKLDNVDVKQILPVLQNYKYYDFSITKDIFDMVCEIKKSIDRC